MIPSIIVEQKEQNVKQSSCKDAFGLLELKVSSDKEVSLYGINLINLKLNTLSGQVYMLKVHDFHLAWEYEDDGYCYGSLDIHVSFVVDANDGEHIVAVNYILNGLNVDLHEISVLSSGEIVKLKVNDFSFDWQDVYDE